MAIFEARVELVHADARRTELAVVASHAILREEGLHNLVERRFERGRGTAHRLAQQKTRCERNPEKGKQRESEQRVQSNRTIP
jgi:hypothetical protein